MDRVIVLPDELPMDTDVLRSQKNALVAISKIMEAILGANNGAYGLTCVPTIPASLQVVINPGQLYQLLPVDSTSYGALSADAHVILRQGLLLDALTLNCPAPTTAGFSINYLIQCQVQELDSDATVRLFYNAGDITSPYSGPADAGTPSNTTRKHVCNITVKAGTAATTGTQTTPTADSGFLPLYVVTVAYGQTAIIAGNISVAVGSPFVTVWNSLNLTFPTVPALTLLDNANYKALSLSLNAVTTDTWYTWDLSGLVPVGATSALIIIEWLSTAQDGHTMLGRPNGSGADGSLLMSIKTPNGGGSSDYTFSDQVHIPLGNNRKFDYKFTNLSTGDGCHVNLYLVGWIA